MDPDWLIDAELANEVATKDMSSTRFPPPGSFDKRAQWVETLARSNRHADLVRQMVDFRRSRMRNNEGAFDELVGMARAGDTGAGCLAAVLYGNHAPEVSRRWKYTFEEVASLALRAEALSHPVCAGVEGALYVSGSLGHPKDLQKARPRLFASALAGSYMNTMFLAGTHLDGTLRGDLAETGRNLCWRRVAEQLSPHAGFATTCEMYRLGMRSDENFEPVPVTPAIQAVARQWCDAAREVTARTCVDLEQGDQGGK